MRLMLGVFSLFAAVSTFASCGSLQDDNQRLSCFDQLAQCQMVSDKDARLACYEQGGQNGLPAAAVVAVPSNEVDVKVAAVEAAFPPPSARDSVEEEPPEIHSSIVALQKDARGYFYLTLANGHIWREKENVRNRYTEGDQVIISKGALNSNQLRMVDKGRMVRVERYK